MKSIESEIVANYKDIVLGMTDRINRSIGTTFILGEGRLSKTVKLTDVMIQKFLGISKSTYFIRKNKNRWKLDEIEKLIEFLNCWEQVEKTGIYNDEYPIT